MIGNVKDKDSEDRGIIPRMIDEVYSTISE